MKNIFGLILLLFAVTGYAQDLLRLSVITNEYSENIPLSSKKPLYYPDSLSLRSGIDSLLTRLTQFGYFDAKLKKLTPDSAGFTALISTGNLYYWHLRTLNISPETIREGNLGHYFKENPIPHFRFIQLQKSIIEWFENNGYPFASLHTDSILIEDNILSAVLRIELNQRVVFDPVQLTGNVKLAGAFIAGITGIKAGMPYNEKLATAAPELINDLTFLRISGNASIDFIPGTAILKIPVSRQPSNRFDGIVGVSGNATEQNRLQLTGQLNLHLVNIFESGENMSVNWLGMGQGTQRLLLEASWPFLLSTPVTPSWMFALHKQDTSYISLRQRPAFSWKSPKRILLTIFADFQRTQLLSTARFKSIITIPPHIDSRTSLFGIETAAYSPGFNSALNRAKGFRIWIAAGTKKIMENKSLPSAVYNDVMLHQNKFAFGIETEIRIPATNQSSLVFQFRSQGLTGHQIFENELMRIGGFRSLKGFDEESIMASAFAIMTGEWRYFLSENSYISFLFNAAWVERKTGDSYFNGWPWGGGTGITLQTAPGNISVYYALGKSPQIPFEFRNAKVHIGFVSLF